MEPLEIIPYDTHDRLRELLNKKGITQEKLAHDLDVSVITVSKWFNGGVIRAKNLIKLSQYFNCDLEFLTCKQGAPNKTHKNKIELTRDLLLEEVEAVQKLLSDTKHAFTIHPNFETGEYIEVTDYEIKGKYKYKNVYLQPVYADELTYCIITKTKKEILLNPNELKAFLDSIKKYIAFQINDLVDTN